MRKLKNSLQYLYLLQTIDGEIVEFHICDVGHVSKPKTLDGTGNKYTE